MNRYKITNIDWCVEKSDVDVLEQAVYDHFDDYSDEEAMIAYQKAILPAEMFVFVDDEEDIANAMSDETGWLVYDFDVAEVCDE